MKRKMVLSAMLCTTLAISTLIGCSQDPDEGKTPVKEETTSIKEDENENTKDTENAKETDVTIELETGLTGERLEKLEEVIKGFTDESGIGVEIIAPGDDYENVMKTRMASNDLPDIWETHGWSTTRYKEYLTPLDDQKWIDKIQKDIKKTVTADDGSIYVVPVSIDPASICYNKTIFKEAGVNAGDIRTWDDFEEACEKIKKIGKIPVYVGGKSVNNIANLFEVTAPGFLTNEDVVDNQSEALLDGSFDWEKYWSPIAKMLAGWFDKGYTNEDILTASDDASIQALANGEGAIVISGNHTITNALTYNPDAELGILAIPATSSEGKSYVSSGEGSCYGMWKDSEYQEECHALLDYFARPEVCEAIATLDGKIPAMEGVTNENEYVTIAFNEMQDTFKDDILFIQYFDRAFLPSGMWNDMGVSGNEIFMDTKGGIEKCIDLIQSAYEEKLGQ